MTKHLSSVDSTQDEARRAYEAIPLLVIADRQVAGRGRLGRRWIQPEVGLFASLAFEPGWPASALPRLALVAGLAARDVVGVDLKWPNDLVKDAGKVGGVLSETSGRVVVIGLGLNLLWADPLPGAAALHDTDPGTEHASSVARGWAARLLARAGEGPDDWGRNEYRAACTTIGTPITWEPGGAGLAVDIAGDGALVVESRGERLQLRAGEVREVRATTLPGESEEPMA